MSQHLPPIAEVAVAVLGATGAVGQTFIRLLADHPWFELAEVAASERSAGKTYAKRRAGSAERMPSDVRRADGAAVRSADVSAPIVFSALDSSVAGDVEAAFARAGAFVLSNAKNYRMEPDVPLVIAEVNRDHLGLLDAQRREPRLERRHRHERQLRVDRRRAGARADP